MHSLQEIKGRISAVTKIKKITRAMQLVSTAKIVKAKKNLLNVRGYCEKVYDVFETLFTASKNMDKILKTPKSKSELYILVTSDLGLCGSYNSNVNKIAHKEVKSHDQIIFIGLKGISNVKKSGFIEATFKQIGDKPNYLIASKVAKIAISKFLAGSISKVKIIYTKYVNAITCNPIVSTILPLDVKQDKKHSSSRYELEPNPESIIKNSLPLYISALVYEAMTESKVSEITLRRTAMENATDNASELIDNLRLKYNQERQSKITQEISEIVVGSEVN